MQCTERYSLMLKTHFIPLLPISYCGSPVIYRYIVSEPNEATGAYPIIICTHEHCANSSEAAIKAFSYIYVGFYEPFVYFNDTLPEDKISLQRFYQNLLRT